MRNEHFEAFLNNGLLGTNGKLITIDSVKAMTIGAKISTANSTFIVQPIFDLSLLNKNGHLDINLASNTKAVTEIKLTSSKSASSNSEQQSYDFKASASGAGVKASGAYHQDSKRQESSSDGSVSVKMSYNTTGAYVELLTGGFSNDASFTPYLIGTLLTDDTVRTYVNYKESYVTGQSGAKYISELGFTNGGQLSDLENVYGNIQLLGEME